MLQNVIRRRNRITTRHCWFTSNPGNETRMGGKEEQSKKLEKDKHSFCKDTVKWTQLKEVVKNWTTGPRNNRISVPAELIMKMGGCIHHRFFWDKFLVLHIYEEVQEHCEVFQERGYYFCPWQY